MSLESTEFVHTITLAGGQTTGTGKATFLAPVPLRVVGVQVRAGTAPTGAALIVDVNNDGTTVFTTQANRPTVAAGANLSGLAKPDKTERVAAVKTGANPSPAKYRDEIDAGKLVTVDVDQIGSTVAGSDLTIAVLFERI